MTQTTFVSLFLTHWDAGTGLRAYEARRNAKLPPERPYPAPRPRWTVAEFVDALGHMDLVCSEDAVETWRNGKHLPRRPQMLAILDVFFLQPATEGPPHTDRQAMFDAWTAEQRPRGKQARSPLEPVPEAKDEHAADWPRENPRAIAGLVALELLTPHADNETGGHRLRGRLVLGAREDDTTEHPVLVTIRPDQAFLAVETSQGVITDGSLVGVREAHDNLKEAPGGLRVVGPKASLTQPDGSAVSYLEGEVFGGSHLAVVTGSDPSLPAAVTVSVSVGKRGFDVTPLDENGQPAAGAVASEAKQALLNALIGPALPRDEQGRAVLQKATLRRRLAE